MVIFTKKTTKHYFISAGLLILSAAFLGLYLSSGQTRNISTKTEQNVLSAQTTLTPTQKPTPTPTLAPTVIVRKVVLPTATQAPTPTPTASPASNTSSSTPSSTSTPTPIQSGPTATPTSTPTPTSAPITSTPAPTATPNATPTPIPVGNTVEIAIDYAGQKANDAYSTTVDAGQTAWDAIKKAVGDANVQYTDYGGNLGVFITGFNGIQAASNQFYEFRVNGVSSNVGVSSYVCNNGDVLAFVLTTF